MADQAVWPTTRLGDVIELKRGYDLPTTSREAGHYPVVSSSGITGTHSAFKVRPPGVVTGRYGTIGQVFYLEEDFWPLNTTLYVRDFKGNDPRFIGYFLRTLDFLQFSDKAAVPGVNRNHVHEAMVRFPPVEEQRAIASVLGALDDKIELNRRMNETLEALARAIFTSWFVDFDPVRARAEGRQPVGMDAETAALFPDSFEDSPLGPIPSGWRVVELGEIATNERRQLNPEELAESRPYIGLDDMPRRSIALTNWGSSAEAASAKSAFEGGEILFGKLRPYFHKVGVAPIDGICSTDILVLRASDPLFGMPLIFAASSDAFVQLADSTSSGTRMPRAKWQDLARYQVILPPNAVLGAFDSLVRPMIERLLANIHETRSLASTRDTLLPKLVSGQLRVTWG